MDILDLLERGGPMLWLVAASLLSGATFGIERLIVLTRRKCAPKDFEKDVIHIADHKGIDAAISNCRLKPSPLARVLTAALTRHGASLAQLEEAARNETRLVRADLLRHVNVCGWFALLAPILGFGAIGVSVVERLMTTTLAHAQPGDQWDAMVSGVAEGIPVLTLSILTCAILVALYALTRGRARGFAIEIEERAIEAILTLDRKARQSIRLVEDIDDRIKTESMIKIPDLSAEFDEHHRGESAARTAVTTHESPPTDAMPPQKGESSRRVPK